MKKLTPILLVDKIEPCLPFWERLGFQKTVDVPHEDRLGFVILVRDSCEVMLQIFDSVVADVPEAVSSRVPGTVMLYFEVEDIDAIEPMLGDAPIVVPRRKTFYGTTEIFVREPAGHVVGFAQQRGALTEE